MSLLQRTLHQLKTLLFRARDRAFELPFTLSSRLEFLGVSVAPACNLLLCLRSICTDGFREFFCALRVRLELEVDSSVWCSEESREVHRLVGHEMVSVEARDKHVTVTHSNLPRDAARICARRADGHAQELVACGRYNGIGSRGQRKRHEHRLHGQYYDAWSRAQDVGEGTHREPRGSQEGHGCSALCGSALCARRSLIIADFLDYYFQSLAYLAARKERRTKFDADTRARGLLPPPTAANIDPREKAKADQYVAEWKSYCGRERVILRKRRAKLRVDQFHIIAQVGQGGYGEVYLARKVDSGEVCALKKMRKRTLFKMDEACHHITCHSSVNT